MKKIIILSSSLLVVMVLGLGFVYFMGDLTDKEYAEINNVKNIEDTELEAKEDDKFVVPPIKVTDEDIKRNSDMTTSTNDKNGDETDDLDGTIADITETTSTDRTEKEEPTTEDKNGNTVVKPDYSKSEHTEDVKNSDNVPDSDEEITNNPAGDKGENPKDENFESEAPKENDKITDDTETPKKDDEIIDNTEKPKDDDKIIDDTEEPKDNETDEPTNPPKEDDKPVTPPTGNPANGTISEDGTKIYTNAFGWIEWNGGGGEGKVVGSEGDYNVIVGH